MTKNKDIYTEYAKIQLVPERDGKGVLTGNLIEGEQLKTCKLLPSQAQILNESEINTLHRYRKID